MGVYDPDRYVRLLRFAARRHAGQAMPHGADGVEYPYLVHVISVTAEIIAILPHDQIDADLAIGCALLHDSIEDTAKTSEAKQELADEIAREFGEPIRDGVLALTKRDSMADGTPLPKADRMVDSLRRIREEPYAVWAVKLADRITNLAPPPAHWDKPKCAAYRAEAQAILESLGEACEPLAARLRARIDDYARHC
jgi:(p)ppGpp synthase/HD superfamily hydrolase